MDVLIHSTSFSYPYQEQKTGPADIAGPVMFSWK